MLLLYTDGLTEARNAAGVEWGCRGLLGAVGRVLRQGHRDAQAVVKGILDSLSDFTDGRVASDDRTLVVICFQ
jgi:serine phosphatase RsbU (regulator of sigma subunit)